MCSMLCMQVIGILLFTEMVDRGNNYEYIRPGLPTLRTQDGPTCLFNAIGYTTDLAWPGVWIDADSYADDYESQLLVPVGYDWNPRAVTALELFKNRGVKAICKDGNEIRVRIAGYKCHAPMIHERVFPMIESGANLMGTFAVRPKEFANLGDRIYELDTPFQHNEHPASHIVTFVGHGKKNGRPYLVFLNTHGSEFGTLGLGRVYFDQVFQDPREEHKGFRFISVLAGAHPTQAAKRGRRQHTTRTQEEQRRKTPY
ncbi:uncharacterized protein LOC125547482 [Triticum urartu]|uniref:uncharacterized protein LOC125547482 n=1 Tax=Triticum urartu TaxID=4572 RepID=UPI0020434422|nr:uncharacterized protein LOC125547482 [Triticum urartu]